MRKFTPYLKDMFQQQRLTPLSQLGLLIGLCGFGIIVSAIITGILGRLLLNLPVEQLSEALTKPENISFSRLLQVITTFLVMGLPALILAGISSSNPTRQLGLRTPANLLQAILVIFMVAAGFLVSGSLMEITELIPIPATAANYFRQLEDQYNKAVMSIGAMNSFADYLFSLFILAIVPAIFEELLFRGCLQRILITITKNAALGIIIASVVFSAIHISYYGFLPRLFLGVMLGYIFFLSKNIWLSIWAHFLNNAYTLTVMYSMSRQGKVSVEAAEDSFPWYYFFLGALLIVLLLLSFKKSSDVLWARSGYEPENN